MCQQQPDSVTSGSSSSEWLGPSIDGGASRGLQEIEPWKAEALRRMRSGEGFESIARDITPRLREWRERGGGIIAGGATEGGGGVEETYREGGAAVARAR